MPARRTLWWVLGIASVAWAGSWRIIYLEVTRWHHLDARLRFTPPPQPPGHPPPSAGLPVIMAIIVAGAAPLTALIVTLLLVRSTIRTRRADGPEGA